MGKYLFYSWPTPNSYKVTILLKELQLPYEFRLVNISKGDQFQAEFLKLNPNNKIPVLVDESTGSVLFESGCILEYLADKHKKFLAEPLNPTRYDTLKWLYWQVGGLGPMLGQNHHFLQYAPEQIPYAIERYLNESKRLYRVLDHQLSKTQSFVAGNEISIADFAIYPWIVPHERQKIKLEDYPSLKVWFHKMASRPAVIEAYAEGEKLKQGQSTVSEESKKFLFGQKGDHLK